MTTPLRCLDPLKKTSDDGCPTHTSREQEKVEKSVLKCYSYIQSAIEVDPQIPRLFRDAHLNYLKKGLSTQLSAGFQSLDCSRAWIVYWVTHPLSLLEDEDTLLLYESRICETLKRFSNPTGGYGGGPQQISHLAATYAAINALVTLSSKTSLTSINRNTLFKYLRKMQRDDGSFMMHDDGEIDVRGVYCAISVATLCGINDEKFGQKSIQWLLSCQTYEGGFSGVPGGEAHGGYTFCAVAALTLLNALDKCNLKSLLRWVSNRQQSFEGGFSGRTNKLVDGCYSFWNGAVFPILQLHLRQTKPHVLPSDKWLFNPEALQEYLLCCCQESTGGFLDKPDKMRDYYHTCYGLSGISIAQNTPQKTSIIGSETNHIIPVHPLYNINFDSVCFTREFFKYND